MRLSLCFVWILSLHTAAQHPPDAEEGDVQPGWRRQSPGGPTPPRLDARKPAGVRGAGGRPAAVRGAGGKLGVRSPALNGPHVCGGRCCVGWTLSPRTRRCTKPRCLPLCHNAALCRQSNRCVCRQGFHGYRCESSTATSVRPSGVPLVKTAVSPSGRHLIRMTRVLSARSGPVPILTTSRPKPGPSDLNPPGTPNSGPAAILTTSRPKLGPSDLNSPETPDPGPDKSGVKTEDKGGVSKGFLMQENQASSKRPQMGQRPEFSNLQLWNGDTKEEGAETTTSLIGVKPDPEPEETSFKPPDPESLSWSQTERKVSLDLKETSLIRWSDSETKTQNLESRSKVEDLESNPGPSKVHRLNLESNHGPSKEYRLNLEASTGPSKEHRINLESNPGPSKEHRHNLESNHGPSKVHRLNLESNHGPSREHKLNLESNHGPSKEHRLNLESNHGPSKEHRLNLESNHGPSKEHRLNLESNHGPSKEHRLNLESNPGSRGQKNVDDGVTGENKRWEEEGTKSGEKKKEEKEEEENKDGEEEKKEGEKKEEKKKEEKKEEEEKREEMEVGGAKTPSLSLREVQAVLLRKTLSRGGRGDKMAALLMKHIEKERRRVPAVTSSSNSSSSSSSSSVKTSVNTFYTQKGQYTVHVSAPSADGQTVSGGGGGGAERIQVMFTPTICKVRCSQDRCVNYCERGNVTTLYSSSEGGGGGGGGGGRRDSSHGPGFRVFLCPLLCKNGGVCLQKDSCLCPPNFTGKFCQISAAPTAVAAAASPSSASSSTNEIVKPALLSAMAANQDLTQSEFLLPLGQNQETGRSGAPGPSMVKVRVQHPPEASVKIHQVLKVSGFSPTLRTLSSSSSGSAGAPAPAGAAVQAQTVRGGGTFTHQAGFKYCFREVKDGQCSSPLPGLRSREMCCRGIGKAWGITDCVLCPDNAGQGNSSCPAGFERANGTQCVDVNECLHPGLCENGICVNTRGSYSCVCRVGFILDASHGICISQSVISEEKGQCHRVLGSGRGPSSCSLPILRNITKQICCCSRVGKAWGPDCQRCPYFGSVAFKEICPAGPGYQYSASAHQFNQRVSEQLGSRGAPLVPHDHQDNQSNQGNQGPGSESISTGSSRSSSAAGGARTSGSAVTSTTYTRPSPPQPQPPPRPQPQPQPPPRPQPQPQPQPRPQPQPQPQPQPRPQPQPQPRPQPQPQPQPQPRPQPQPPPRPQPQPQPPPRPQPQPQPRPQPQPGLVDSPSSKPVQPGSVGTTATQDKPPSPGRPRTEQNRPDPAPPFTTQPRPQPPSTGSQGGRSSTASRPDQPAARGDSLPAPAQPHSPERGLRPSGELPPLSPAVSPTTRPAQVQPVPGVCESRPGVCGRGRCVDQPGGKHTCVCDHGYQPTSQRTYCQDVNECVQSPGVCAVGECVNTMGSYKCMCPSGYRSNSQQTSCQDINECLQNPCSNGRCDNTPGSYRCVCRLGYRLIGNTCTDVDECEDALQCPGQQCVNSQGSYHCVSCQPGFRLINRLCSDIDECRQAPCSNGRCENTPGSYHCVCRHGYKLQNNTCTDIDECAEPSQCPGQMCVNTVGSYRCVSCRPGYTLINRQCSDVNECEDSESCPGQQCVNTEGSYRCVDCQQGYHSVNGLCADVDECVQGSHCPGQQCVNTVGSYRCVSCQPGYSNKDGSCQDIDECASAGACEAERVCVNTVGSFRCDCPAGYRTSGLGRQCRDINECLEGDFCFPKGECVNSPGSYSCVCSQGFTLSDNGTTCSDVDECVKSGLCSDGLCVNTEGSFHCQCQTGFTTNPERTACLDVDECISSGGSVCASQRCENTIGSYRCLTSCEPGYRVTQTGSCVDINECANKTVCGDHAFCQNLIGTYLCVCDQGFTATTDGKACVDEDECVSLPGVCGSARCENVEGSFMCECDRRGEEFDTTSRRCVNTSPQAGFPPSSSFHVSMVELAPQLPPLPAARPGELRECYYNLAERGTCSLLATNTSQQECCCTVGEGWGLGCQYHTCPATDTAEFLSLCPSGRGYVTTGPGAFSYRDVDECKRFHPEVCKNGVCVNNIPGYNCYCSSGYVYNSTLLECVDHDECEEESCVGGVCVNTVGSYYCSCQPPLVLDDTQRNCVNSSHLTVDENLSLCWQHVTADLVCQSPLLGAQVTFMDCCCLYGEGWGMECALCPPTDSDDYATLCSSFPPPLFPESFPDSGPTGVRPGAGPGRGGVAPPYFPPYSPDSFPAVVVPDYDDYSPAGGSRSVFRGRTPTSFSQPDASYHRSEFSTGYYSEGDFAPPDGSPPRPPSYRLPPDPRAERAFGARPPPPSRPDGPPLSLAPLPGSPYEVEQQEEEEEVAWRPGPPFPPFTERSRGGGGGAGGAPRRVYERRYDSYAGLSTAEDCGILHGCENGRCIRVAEGYTCDCYPGYELDMTSMTCIDRNECEDAAAVDFPCVNARCVNTDGSFRCVCRRGYVMSRRPNHCVAA